MNLRLTIEDELVLRARQIAEEQGKTLTEMIRDYVSSVVTHGDRDRCRREMAQLEQSFREVQVNVGERSWRRQDLYERVGWGG